MGFVVLPHNFHGAQENHKFPFLPPTMTNRNPPVRPALLTRVANERPPAVTCRPYDQLVRRTAIAVRFAGQENDENIRALRAAKMWPSKWSVQRWTRRLIAEGTIAPY